MVKALIMAGGIGERLWPVSTPEKPKQFHSFGSKRMMIEKTIDRIKNIVDDIYIVTTKKQAELFYRYLRDFPKENIISEPARKNTAPAIVFGSAMMNDEDIMVILPADHIIRDIDLFQKTIMNAVDEAKKHDELITIGISPSEPNTGYGYIERGELLDSAKNLYRVKMFHEKPNHEKANLYFTSGKFYWNSGMFIWRKKVLIDAVQKKIPEVYRGYLEYLEDSNKFEEIYSNLPSISIDYGIMEKSTNVEVIPGNFYWNDIGSWLSVYDLEKKDSLGNAVIGNFKLNEVSNSLLINYTENKIGITDLNNVAVIVSDEGILISDINKTQNVKKLL